MPIDTITPVYQAPMIEEEPVYVDAIEPDLNTDFQENVPLYMMYIKDQERKLQDSPELHAQVDSKNLLQRCLPKQAYNIRDKTGESIN